MKMSKLTTWKKCGHTWQTGLFTYDSLKKRYPDKCPDCTVFPKDNDTCGEFPELI